MIKEGDMKVLVLKTNIKSELKKKKIEHHFNNHKSIYKWSIDLEDIDKVLRIEACHKLPQKEVLNLISAAGFSGEELTY